eukprot:Gregarina_sp_Poly_1__2143@NODE_156_length_12377_cov_161_699350_g138_i0_p7_GENE_NODE_156_length_12377_cov_161_699350_g138_i0NODE_156_length_12377_cov_161_699350_g138_i0_p7_ORF_typecomplete_len132_score4_79_NODE_156_length_12377_cov_161_699350_g138_i036844079
MGGPATTYSHLSSPPPTCKIVILPKPTPICNVNTLLSTPAGKPFKFRCRSKQHWQAKRQAFWRSIEYLSLSAPSNVLSSLPIRVDCFRRRPFKCDSTGDTAGSSFTSSHAQTIVTASPANFMMSPPQKFMI